MLLLLSLLSRLPMFGAGAGSFMALSLPARKGGRVFGFNRKIKAFCPPYGTTNFTDYARTVLPHRPGSVILDILRKNHDCFSLEGLGMEKKHIDNLPEEGAPAQARVSRRKFFTFTGLGTLAALAASLLPVRFSGGLPSLSPAWAAGSGKAKNILVITGSGRVDGNSDLLAEAFMQGAREAGHTVNVFHSGRERISGCLFCGGCWSTGKPCVIEDAFDGLWPLLEQAELLVLCSPLYCYTFSGHIKNAMDRMYPYWQKNRPRKLKVSESMLLMCGQSWFKKSFDGAAESYRQMRGYAGWTDRGRLFVTGVHEKGEISGDKDLKTAEKMGREA